MSEELHALHDELMEFDEEDPAASTRFFSRAEVMLHLDGLTWEEHDEKEVTELAKMLGNGLGHWLTFVTEPEVDSTNNRAKRSLREQVAMRKIFRSLWSDECVRIQETVTTMLATWQRRGLDPPEQLQSVLGGQELISPWEVSLPSEFKSAIQLRIR